MAGRNRKMPMRRRRLAQRTIDVPVFCSEGIGESREEADRLNAGKGGDLDHVRFEHHGILEKTRLLQKGPPTDPEDIKHVLDMAKGAPVVIATNILYRRHIINLLKAHGRPVPPIIVGISDGGKKVPTPTLIRRVRRYLPRE